MAEAVSGRLILLRALLRLLASAEELNLAEQLKEGARPMCSDE